MDENHEEGYDSDGELPYFGDTDWELFLMENYTEDTLTSTPPVSTSAVASQQQQVLPPIAEFELKKVTQLRQELKNRGFSNHNIKPVLLECLQKAVK